MTNIFSLAFKVSRVRFWLYLGGTYAVGYLIGMSSVQDILSPFFVVHFLYFLIPANIFLYGINDLADRDTDMFNPKKNSKEYKAVDQDTRKLYALILFSTIYGLSLLLLQPDLIAGMLFLSWMALSTAYSLRPFRFKSVPFLDFISNFLYVIPALLAFYQLRQVVPPMWPIFAAFLWTSAMQLFSAVPDIDADQQAGIKTTAVVIGEKASLLLCTLFWLGFALILVLIHPWNFPWNLLTFVYPLIPLVILVEPTMDINRIYWLFPYWTGFFGMLLSITIGLPKLMIL